MYWPLLKKRNNSSTWKLRDRLWLWSLHNRVPCVKATEGTTENFLVYFCLLGDIGQVIYNFFNCFFSGKIKLTWSYSVCLTLQKFPWSIFKSSENRLQRLSNISWKCQWLQERDRITAASVRIANYVLDVRQNRRYNKGILRTNLLVPWLIHGVEDCTSLKIYKNQKNYTLP